MTANQIARQRITAEIAADIRRASAGMARVSLDVALANWAFFFDAGRYTEARTYWRSTVQPIMEGK